MDENLFFKNNSIELNLINYHQNKNELNLNNNFYENRSYLNDHNLNASKNLELVIYDENLIFDNDEHNENYSEFYYSEYDNQYSTNNNYNFFNQDSSEEQNNLCNQNLLEQNDLRNQECNSSNQQYLKLNNQNNLQVYDYDFHSLVKYNSENNLHNCNYNLQDLNELNSKFNELKIDNYNKITELEIKDKENKKNIDKSNYIEINSKNSKQKINNELENDSNLNKEDNQLTGLEIVPYNELNDCISENFYLDKLDYLEEMKENIYYDSLNDIENHNQLDETEENLLRFYKNEFRNNFPELFKKKKSKKQRLISKYIKNKNNPKSKIDNFQLNDNENEAPIHEIDQDNSLNDFYQLF